jgi:phage tail-like protein
MPSTNQSTRAYSAAHFVLELDDNNVVGFFRSVEGGGVSTEILTYQAGSSAATWRQLGKPKYEDLKIQVGMGMSDSFYDWIAAFFGGDIVRKNGAIVAGDFHYRERARREFYDALISEIAFPALDATDRNAAYMTVTIVPERIRFARGSNERMDPRVGSNRQKLWTASNFEFTIKGFEQACYRVTKLDGFAIKQKIHEYHAGNARDALRVPGSIEFPNLTFYVPEADAQPFIDHFTKHVINGEPQAAARSEGEITMKDHHGGELCVIHIYGIDLARVEPDKSDASSENIKQIKVEISVEDMKFVYAKADGSMLE